jgi:tRNA A37 methylthiotransferase MiaB
MITKQNYHSPKIVFVSLGCPKAGSDSEKMLDVKIKSSEDNDLYAGPK